MSSVEVGDVFEGRIELVYEFILFFHLMGAADPKYRRHGWMEPRERAAALRKGRKVVTRWQYPVDLLIEDQNGPVVVSFRFRFLPQDDGATAVSQTFSLVPLNFFGRLLTFRERRHMKRGADRGSVYRGFLRKMKVEFEHRKQTGIEEAFEYFRSQLAPPAPPSRSVN